MTLVLLAPQCCFCQFGFLGVSLRNKATRCPYSPQVRRFDCGTSVSPACAEIQALRSAKGHIGRGCSTPELTAESARPFIAGLYLFLASVLVEVVKADRLTGASHEE